MMVVVANVGRRRARIAVVQMMVVARQTAMMSAQSIGQRGSHLLFHLQRTWHHRQCSESLRRRTVLPGAHAAVHHTASTTADAATGHHLGVTPHAWRRMAEHVASEAQLERTG